MNTLKHLIKNFSVAFLPGSLLDGIVAQGFSRVDGKPDSPLELHLPEDGELYRRGNEMIIYNGRTDTVISRYSLHSL
jgi:hypothetical protein